MVKYELLKQFRDELDILSVINIGKKKTKK